MKAFINPNISNIKSEINMHKFYPPPPPQFITFGGEDGHENAASFFMAFSRLPVRISPASSIAIDSYP